VYLANKTDADSGKFWTLILHNKAIAVSLNDDALNVIRSQLGKHHVRMFTFKGKLANDA
jgi:hypothetical protein